MTHRLGACLLIFAALTGACQPAPQPAGPGEPGGAEKPAPETDAAASDKPLAYVQGAPVRRDQVFRPLIETAGGQVLAELVLDRLVQDRLDARGLTLTEADLTEERQRVQRALSGEQDDENQYDENQAARLLRELRRQRGLGDTRFKQLVRRNAGLRKLVADDVDVTEQSLKQAYKRRFGPRYRARVITVDQLREASRLRKRVLTGEARFADLAAIHSTDASADRGGLLAPISPADPTYPAAIREGLQRLAQQAATQPATQPATPPAKPVSEVIALDEGFALLQLEEKIAAEPVEFADVKRRLRDAVRLELEQRLMRQLARNMLSDADVVVLDPALGKSWRRQRDVLLSP